MARGLAHAESQKKATRANSYHVAQLEKSLDAELLPLAQRLGIYARRETATVAMSSAATASSGRGARSHPRSTNGSCTGAKAVTAGALFPLSEK